MKTKNGFLTLSQTGSKTLPKLNGQNFYTSLKNLHIDKTLRNQKIGQYMQDIRTKLRPLPDIIPLSLRRQKAHPPTNRWHAYYGFLPHQRTITIGTATVYSISLGNVWFISIPGLSEAVMMSF